MIGESNPVTFFIKLIRGNKMKKIAYLVLVHNDPDHLLRLIDAINFNCDIYIHIDYKANLDDFRELKKYDNIYFCESRKNICWGGFNMVLAMKELIKMSLNKNKDYSHLVFLSGSDYPIKNKEEIYEYFIKNEGKELIKAFYIDESNCEHCYDKIQRYRFFDKNIKHNKIDKVIKKVLEYTLYPFKKDIYIYSKNQKIRPAFGSQWFAITPKCAEYILEYSEKNKRIDNYFKTSFAPDEMYFHTIIFNSQFKYNTINGGEEVYKNKEEYVLNNFHQLNSKNLMCKDKVPKLKEHIRDDISRIIKGKQVYKGSIPFYTEIDFENIKDTKYMFIRKVNTEHSRELLNKIDNMK